MGIRIEAKIPASLWDAPDFVGLDASTQWLYLSLLTSVDLRDTGVMPLLPRRWSRLAANIDEHHLVRRLHVLHEAGFVFADFDWQEVFVSGYYEIERIASQPRRLVGIADAMKHVRSAPLVAFASAELTVLIDDAVVKPPRGIRAHVLERDGWKCLKCGWRPGDSVPTKRDRPLYRGLEIDHIHPKSKGGPDTLDNFQVLCTSCNASKGARI